MASGWSWDGTLTPADFQDAAMNFVDKWAKCCPTSEQWRWNPCPKLPWGASHDANGYLSFENVHVYNSQEQHDVSEGIPTDELEEEEPSDPATLVQNFNNELHLYTFHVLYNNSYRVPILFFHGRSIDGQPLKSEDIEKDLPSYSRQALKDAKWTFLTQEEHPYLNRPWYSLHPCGTSKWMSIILSDRRLFNAMPTLMSGHFVALSESKMEREGDNGQNTSFVESTSSNANSSSNNMVAFTHGIIQRDTIVHHYLIAWLSIVGQAVGLKIPSEIVKCHA